MDKNRICWSWAKDIIDYTHMLLIFFKSLDRMFLFGKYPLIRKNWPRPRKSWKDTFYCFHAVLAEMYISSYCQT